MDILLITLGSLFSTLLVASTIPVSFGNPKQTALSVVVLVTLLFFSHFIGDMFANVKYKACQVLSAGSSALGGVVSHLAFQFLVKQGLVPKIANNMMVNVAVVSVSIALWNVTNIYALGNSCN